MTTDINFHNATGYRIGPVKRGASGTAWREIHVFMDDCKVSMTIFADGKDPENLAAKQPHHDWAMTTSVEAPGGFLDDVEAGFDIDLERYSAEHFSWGESRGMETAATATLIWLKIGDLQLSAEDAAAMLGRDEISGLEREAEQRYQDNHG